MDILVLQQKSANMKIVIFMETFKLPAGLRLRWQLLRMGWGGETLGRGLPNLQWIQLWSIASYTPGMISCK